MTQSHEQKRAVPKTLENTHHISAHIWNSYEQGLLLKKTKQNKTKKIEI